MYPKAFFALLAAIILVFTSTAILHAQTPERELNLNNRQTKTGRYYALVIGNDNYPSLTKLKTAKSDAQAVAAVLQDKFNFQKPTLLLDATRQQIMVALGNYRRDLDENANLLIFYAGHGYNDRNANRASWLPVDADPDNISNWISADDIIASIRAIPARHVLIISDSCFSGTLTRKIEPNIINPEERERYLQKMLEGHSRTLMASGGDEPVSDGGGDKSPCADKQDSEHSNKGHKHSIFAGALLRGLCQTDKEKFTAGELFRDFIQESVSGRADQTPEYTALRNSGHDKGDFVFVKSILVSQPPTTPPNTAAKGLPILKDTPKDARTWYNLGVAILNQPQPNYPKAEEAFAEVIRLDGKNILAYYNLGVAQMNQSKCREATGTFQKYITLAACSSDAPSDGRCAKAYFNIGVELECQKKYAEAEDAFTKALNLNPQFIQAVESLNRVRLERAREKQN